MALIHAERVKETTTTTGTGAYSLAGAVSGFQTFVAGAGAGAYRAYTVTDGTNWESGIGTITDGAPDTLSRDYITASSNGGAPVNWGAGTKTVVCALTARMLETLQANFPDGDPNGFTNAAEWTFAYDAGTRTLTLTPVEASASFWSNGLKFTKTSAQALAHPDTEGMHYWYFDDTGTLVTTTAFSQDLILKYCIVAAGYWDATNNQMVPDIQWEMHGCVLSSYEHMVKHVTVGSIFNKQEGGLAPTVTLGDGSADTHIQVAASAGSFFDEDIKHVIATESAGTNKVKLYRNGANGDWRMEATHSAIVRTGGSGRALYNQWTGAVWQDTECTDGYFMHVYKYMTNAPTPTAVYVQGQTQFDTIEAAQAAAQTRPNLGALPGYEFLLVQTFIVQTATAYTNTYNSRIVASHTGAGWYDWREAMPQAGSGQSAGGIGVYIDLPTTTPSPPAASTSRIFVKNIGGRPMPAFMGPSGLDSTLQPHFGRNGRAIWTPAGNSTTINALGGAALSATGTATSANYATTSLHTMATRVDYLVTTAATTAVAGYRFGTARYRFNEGFHHIARVCPATGSTVATRRFFCGMSSSTGAPTDVQPSSLTNIVGVGYDAADTNWQVMHNDASGTATKIDTGIARPSADRQSIYSVIIFAPPGGGAVGVQIIDEVTGDAYYTSITTDRPTDTTALAPRAYHSVGGTSSVVGLTLFGLYMETDN